MEDFSKKMMIGKLGIILLSCVVGILLSLPVGVHASKPIPTGDYEGLGAPTRSVSRDSVVQQVELLKPAFLGWAKSILGQPLRPDVEHRFGKVKIKIVSDDELLRTWCSHEADEAKCIAEGLSVEALYHPGMEAIYLRNFIDLESAYGAGTLLHELTHYVQHMTGNFPPKRRVCEIEIEALEAELLLAEYYPEDPATTDFLNEWIDKFKRECD